MKNRRTFFVLPLLAAAFVAPSRRVTAAEVFLSSLGVSGVEQDWGDAQVDRSVEGHALKIGGQTFEHGIGTHAASTWEIALDGQGERFEAQAGRFFGSLHPPQEDRKLPVST